MKELTLKAYAKINLGLDVVRRLPNGYHEVRMLMQTVGIYDVLSFRRQDSGFTIRTDSGELPTDENNLIVKAARLFADTYGIRGGADIFLQKNIPIAAGMAGGSTDAAAAFLGMNRLFDIGVSQEELRSLAVGIGADVPYCIMGGTVLAEGIGEKLTPLPEAPDCYLLVAKPDIHVSTKFVYENLHVDTLTVHPDIDGMIRAVKERKLADVAALLGNVLETVTGKAHPVVGQIKEHMRRNGALNALMSGSGPTVFGIYDEEERAFNACESLRAAGLAKQLFVTRPVHPVKEEG